MKNDESWSIEYVSENVLELLGYSCEELMNEKISYLECIHHTTIARVKEEILKASQDGSDFFEHQPYKIITKDRQEKWVSDQTIIERDANGNITHYIGYINDITQTMQLTQENKLLQERLELAIESAHDGVWDWDIKSGEAFFSREWKAMLGYSDEEIQNTAETFFNLIHPDERKMVKDIIAKHFQDSTIPFLVEMRLLCKDGTYKWILARGKVIFDEDNNPQRMLGVHVDIDYTKKIQERLNRLNKRFTSMFKNHDAIMLIIDPVHAKIIDANLSAQSFYGYNLEEFKSLSIYDLNTASKEEIAKSKLQAVHNENNCFEFQHKKKNGTLVIVEAHTSKIETDQGDLLFSIIMDITKEKENEKELQEVFQQLKQAQKIAKLGLWELNHQLNTLVWSEEVYNIFEVNFKTTKASFELLIEIIHPSDREEVASAYQNSLITKEPYEITHRLLMPDNRVKYVLEQCSTDFDSEGTPLLSRGTVQDITEFHMLDATIRNERKRFKTFMNHASDGILIINKDSKLVEYSKVTQKLLGYSDSEMLELHINDWDVHTNQNELDRLIENLSETPATFERVHKRKDGTIYNASLSAVRMEIEGEKYIYAAIRDISEIKKLQDTILHDKNFIETIIESSNAIVAVINSEGRMIKLNRYAQEFTGYSVKEISQEPYKWKCFLPLDVQNQVISIIENAKQGHITKSYQNEWHSKSGEVKMFEWSNTLVKKEDESMDYIVAIGIDITQNEEQKAFLNLLINSQSHMIILADEYELKYVNQAVLDFFDVINLEGMKELYKCICDSFVENDFSFHLGHISKGVKWMDAIQELPSEKRIVSMFSKKESQERTFKVNIENYDNRKMYLITFIDISTTMKKQFELEYKSNHDALTKAYNREYFYEKWPIISESHKINHQHTAVAMIDIDHFKVVNDTYGHDIGDEVLKNLVRAIQSYSRESDVLIRWGGEEFILLLPIKNENNLSKALEHLRELIAQEPMPKIGHITISIGAAICGNRESIEESIKRADEKLYISKNSGRNRVTL